MTKLLALLAPLVLLSAAAPVLAQYSGPAVQACRTLAEAQLPPGAAGKPAVQLDQPTLSMDRYARKLGSQFVASLLHGEGAIVHVVGVPIEVSFVCLLADERRALFFHWMPRGDAPALLQCRRARDAGACLDTLLVVAEQDLTHRYAQLFVEARVADDKAGNENAASVFRRSSEAFLAYRAAECARRGAAGSEPHKACLVDITRRRALDLR